MEIKDYVPTLQEEEDDHSSVPTTDESLFIKEEDLSAGKEHKTKKQSKPQLTSNAAKDSSKHPKQVSYPTQIMKIGEIRCLFLSCYYQGRTPFLSIGPSWPFTIFLIFFGFFITGFFTFMISLLNRPDSWKISTMVVMLSINWLLLFSGILGNPGIAQSIIDHKLKQQLGKSDSAKKVDEGDNEVEGSKHEETEDQRRNQGRKYVYSNAAMKT